MMLALMLVPLVVCIGHSDLLDPTALTTVYEYTDAATGAVTQCAFGGGIFDASWQDIVSGLGWDTSVCHISWCVLCLLKNHP